MSDTDDILLRRLKEGIEAGEPVKAAGQRAMKSSMDSPAGPTRDQSRHADTGGVTTLTPGGHQTGCKRARHSTRWPS